MAIPPQIIPYQEWMTRTKVSLRSRSALLEALDSALLSYHTVIRGNTPVGHPSRRFVENTFKDWKASKGGGLEWRGTIRNRKNAVDDLNMALAGITYDYSVGPVEVGGMDNARQGVLYLFSGMHVDTGLFNVVLDGGTSIAGSALKLGGDANAATNLKTVMIPGKALLQATAGNALQQATDGAREATTFRKWLEDLAGKILKTLEDKFGKIDLTISALKNLITILVKALCAEAGKALAGGLDIAKGLANLTDSIIMAVNSYIKGKGVEILAGHPSVIVNGIKKSMKMSIGEGLYQSLKGGGGLAMSLASFGGAQIVNIALAAAETLIKFIWRVVELVKMNRFFAQAREYWAENQHEMRMRPDDFNSWFKQTADSIPALSIVTLNSGICGDKMRFLRMYTDETNSEGNEISAEQFNRGVIYVDDLKAVGGDMLKKWGYKFTSEDKFVASLLKSIGDIGIVRNKVWDGVLRVARA